MLRCLDPLKPCGAMHIARERSVPQVTLLLRSVSLPLYSSRAARPSESEGFAVVTTPASSS